MQHSPGGAGIIVPPGGGPPLDPRHESLVRPRPGVIQHPELHIHVIGFPLDGGFHEGALARILLRLMYRSPEQVGNTASQSRRDQCLFKAGSEAGPVQRIEELLQVGGDGSVREVGDSVHRFLSTAADIEVLKIALAIPIGLFYTLTCLVLKPI